MTDDKKLDLEMYFEAGRAADTLPTADLLGRIMADAQAQMLSAQTVQTDVTPVARQSLLANLLTAIGGWPTLAGMATAAVVGVWIGFSQPAGVDLVAEQIWGSEDAGYLVDLIPAFSDGFEEG